MGRPPSKEPGVDVPVRLSPKAIKYLDALKGKDGFGASRSEIVRNFMWKEINRLLEVGRLKEIE